jgi:hypothetical protein
MLSPSILRSRARGRASTTRSLLPVPRAGLALVVVYLAALTGCAGTALDETNADLVEEAPLLDEHAPASPLPDEAQEPSSSLTDPSTSPRDGDEASGPAASGREADALGQSQQPLLGSNTCRDVYVSVRNFWNDPITVRSIEYYNASEGRWQTEDLANRTLDADGGLEIWVEDLENAENDTIYSVNLLFDHLDHTHNMHFNIPDRTCLAGHIMFDLFVE